MSEIMTLVANESDQTLSGLLNDLDTESTQNAHEPHFEKGPFGAFRLSDILPTTPTERSVQSRHLNSDALDSDVDSSQSCVVEYPWSGLLLPSTVENDVGTQIV